MSFGLHNAPQTYQRFMDKAFHDLPFVFAYLDDVLVFSSSPEEHDTHLATVFERLARLGVTMHKRPNAHCNLFWTVSQRWKHRVIDRRNVPTRPPNKSAHVHRQPNAWLRESAGTIGNMGRTQNVVVRAASTRRRETRSGPEARDTLSAPRFRPRAFVATIHL